MATVALVGTIASLITTVLPFLKLSASGTKYAGIVLKLLPNIAQVTDDAVEFVRGAVATITALHQQGRDPTPEEWSALDEQIMKAFDRLQAAATPGA